MKKLLLSVLMLLLAVPAFAVGVPMPDGMKLDIYGSFRLYMNYANNYAKVGSGASTATDNFNYNMQSNSRFGAKFNIDSFFAQVEFDFMGDQSKPASSNNIGASNFGFRQFFAGYKFDNGFTLTAGQKTTLAGNYGEFADVWYNDNGLAGFGAAQDVRRPLVMFSYANVDLALVYNNFDLVNTLPTGLSGSTLQYLPRFEAAYNLTFDAVKGKVFAAYALFNEQVGAGTGKHQVNLQAFNVGTVLKSKMDKFNVTFGAFFGQNTGLFQSALFMNNTATNTTAVLPIYNAGSDTVYSATSVGGALELGYAFCDISSVIVGGGIQYNDIATAKGAPASFSKSYAGYVQVPVKIVKYVTLKPQVGYYGGDKSDGTTVGSLIAGAQLRFDF